MARHRQKIVCFPFSPKAYKKSRYHPLNRKCGACRKAVGKHKFFLKRRGGKGKIKKKWVLYPRCPR